MTARTDRKNRMTNAAAVRTAPEATPAGKTAIRTKPVRITIDLDPAAYTALNRWIENVSLLVNPDAVPFRRLSQSAAVRAMIEATITDEFESAAVVKLLRQGQD